MAEDRKTVINELIIIWQGQSWSVIAPNGQVIGRFLEKDDAINFANQNLKYLDQKPRENIWQDSLNSEEYPFDLPIPENTSVDTDTEKLKNDWVDIDKGSKFWHQWERFNGYSFPRLMGIGLAILVCVVVVVVFAYFAIPVVGNIFVEARRIGSEIVNNSLFKIAFIGTVLVIIQGIASNALDDSNNSGGCLTIFFLMGVTGICQATGILSSIWSWLF